MIVIVWYLDLQLPVQSVPITTKDVGSNPAHGLTHLVENWKGMIIICQ
jgi:RNA polymerase subunit RPABC4/transcription elongation factor Spt4